MARICHRIEQSSDFPRSRHALLLFHGVSPDAHERYSDQLRARPDRCAEDARLFPPRCMSRASSPMPAGDIYFPRRDRGFDMIISRLTGDTTTHPAGAGQRQICQRRKDQQGELWLCRPDDGLPPRNDPGDPLFHVAATLRPRCSSPGCRAIRSARTPEAGNANPRASSRAYPSRGRASLITLASPGLTPFLAEVGVSSQPVAQHRQHERPALDR